jgi:ELWxxDGT repeat protein
LIAGNWFVDVDNQLYGLANDQLTLLLDAPVRFVAEFGRYSIFTADNQLWRSDGTAEGTQPLFALSTGRTYLEHQNETHLYLSNGTSLLATDGTPAGTQRLQTNVDRSYFVDDSSQLTDGIAFVWIQTTTNQQMLFRTDGTPAGTYPIRSLNRSQLVNRMFQVGTQRHFFISDNDSAALWRTDGTAAGTQAVIDPLSVSLGYYGQLDTNVALLYGEQQLWRTSGTAATTFLIKDGLNVWSGLPLEWGGYLYFLAQSSDSFDAPIELWRSDVNSAEKVTTLEALDIYIYGTAAFFRQDNLFYLIAESPTTSEREYILWVIDFATGTATRLADDVGYTYNDQDERLNVGSGNLFMFVNSDGEIWRTDGTPAGTYRIAQTARRNETDNPIGFLGEINGRWLFTGQDDQFGVELWSTDGTPANTRLLKDIHNSSAPSNPKLLQQVGNRVCYVVEDDGENNHALYCSDGMTTELIESRPVTDGSDFRGGMIGHQLYYVVLTADGPELWRTNGTRSGTAYTGVNVPVHFFPLTSATTPNGVHYYVISNVKEEMYPSTKFTTLIYQLWRTDGTPAGTFKLQDLYEGDWTIAPHQLTAVGNQLYFYAYTPDAGMELWRSDGWNTQMVKDIRIGRQSSKPTYTALEMVAVNGTLYFWADDGVHGRELWKSNGTAATTQLVRDIQTGSGSSWLKNLTAVGNRLFFTPATTQGYELWTSYGTHNGTYMVKDIYAPWGSADPQRLTPHHNGVLFSADDGTHGRQLWRSDGTQRGTYRLTDFTGGRSFQEIVTTWNGVYFSLDDGSVWRSDGYSMNVTRVMSSTGRPFFARQTYTPSNIVAVQNRVFLSANAGGGNELWVIDP